jgi:hypothetical protein
MKTLPIPACAGITANQNELFFNAWMKSMFLGVGFLIQGTFQGSYEQFFDPHCWRL